jgi:hypothetical protein
MASVCGTAELVLKVVRMDKLYSARVSVQAGSGGTSMRLSHMALRSTVLPRHGMCATGVSPLRCC